jgi:rhodanese-related sulfurtransferase
MLPPMNDRQQAVVAAPLGSKNLVWRQVIAILGTAVVLGLVYNVASPLGVRAPKTEDEAPNLPTNSRALAPQLTTSVATNPSTETTTSATSVTNASDAALLWVQVKPLLATGQILLVDARAKMAYDIEHIPGAVSLPVESAPADFIAFAMKHPKDTAIVVYCGSDNCDLSHELAEKLRTDLGYTNVREMPGGIAEWRVAAGKATPPGSK